jgi:ribonuclease J
VTHTRIVPLGGLGEIGMNCLALETPQGILVIDCGVTFPHDELGIDVIHPDFTYLWERREEVLGVVVTHGHEDHIGGLPYLLRRIPVPVYAPPYAAILIRSRLAEHAEVPVPDIRTFEPRQRFHIGVFGVEALRVTHSIPDSFAFAIDTPACRVFHTGDFKLETDPPDGHHADEARFRELGADGVAVLLSDSTNVDVESRLGREREVARALRDMILGLEGRVVVGVFASNVYRLQAVATAAMETGRKLCYLGRSVQTHVKAATELGLFRVPQNLVVTPDQAMNLHPREVLAIGTGTQAEPASAIARLARGDHPVMQLERGDAVIFSSRAIPGNERAVFDLICALERRGIEVHFRATDGDIHVSGHAARDEQARMIEMIRPRAFVPIHGTYHHLRRHAELATQVGVREVAIIENGQTARWNGSGLSTGETVPAGRVHVDQGMELSEYVIAERAAMSVAGVVAATIALDDKGSLVGPPAIATRGVVLDDPPDVVTEAARVAIEEAIRMARGPRDVIPREEARDAAHRALRRMYRVGNKRPLVIVQLAEEIPA